MISKTQNFFLPTFGGQTNLFTFFLDEKSKQKNQDARRHCGGSRIAPKTSPIPIVRRGGSGRETPPCFLFAMLPGIEGSDEDFGKMEANHPIHYNHHFTGK